VRAAETAYGMRYELAYVIGDSLLLLGAEDAALAL
jgi:hypothetical protein